MSDTRHTRGRRGEELAADHFERLGFEVLARNHRTRYGELDLVAFDGETLVFAEVKTRLDGSGEPFASLHARKCSQGRRLPAAWLLEPPPRPRAARLPFDGIAVLVACAGNLVRLDHLEAAF